MIKMIGEKEFENEVMASHEVVLVDFFATWCGPCKMLAPILEEVAEERQDLNIYKIDIDKNRDLAIGQEIEFVPTLVLFKEGKEVFRISGVIDKENIIAQIDKYSN